MSTRSRVCAWIASACLLLPSPTAGQERAERDVVELIVRDGPQARAIRAESDVVRREQFARLAYPNPSFTYSREGAGFTEFYQAEQPLPIFGTRDALSRAGVAATAAADAKGMCGCGRCAPMPPKRSLASLPDRRVCGRLAPTRSRSSG